MKFLRSLFLSLAALAAVAASAQNISIATGGTGGVYYPMGGGLAAILSKYVPGMQATAEVTGGSVDNLKLIGSGKPYVGFSMADAALDAAKGEDKFKGSNVPVKTLAVLYPNRMHVVTVEGKGINKFADLKGKRVSTGSPGSATEVMAFRLIEAAGMDSDNKQATVMNILVAHEKMDEKTAYNIVKTLFDKQPELVAVHKEAENIKLENQKNSATPIPFHPGAIKYFAEKGIKVQ